MEKNAWKKLTRPLNVLRAFCPPFGGPGGRSALRSNAVVVTGPGNHLRAGATHGHVSLSLGSATSGAGCNLLIGTQLYQPSDYANLPVSLSARPSHSFRGVTSLHMQASWPGNRNFASPQAHVPTSTRLAATHNGLCSTPYPPHPHSCLDVANCCQSIVGV